MLMTSSSVESSNCAASDVAAHMYMEFHFKEFLRNLLLERPLNHLDQSYQLRFTLNLELDLLLLQYYCMKRS